MRIYMYTHIYIHAYIYIHSTIVQSFNVQLQFLLEHKKNEERAIERRQRSEHSSEGEKPTRGQCDMGKRSTGRQISFTCRGLMGLVSLELHQSGQYFKPCVLITMVETYCSSLTFTPHSPPLNKTIREPFRMHTLESSWVCPISKPWYELKIAFFPFREKATPS